MPAESTSTSVSLLLGGGLRLLDDRGAHGVVSPDTGRGQRVGVQEDDEDGRDHGEDDLDAAPVPAGNALHGVVVPLLRRAWNAAASFLAER